MSTGGTRDVTPPCTDRDAANLFTALQEQLWLNEKAGAARRRSCHRINIRFSSRITLFARMSRSLLAHCRTARANCLRAPEV